MKFWVISFFLILVGCASEENVVIRIACAANIEQAVDSIAQVYQEQTGNEYEIIASASGLISTQIRNGSPYDVFISADSSLTADLYAEKLCAEPKTFAYGHLIIAHTRRFKYSDFRIDSLLLSDQIKKIAIADPEVAPFGKSSINFINSVVEMGQIESKIVYGDNVGQVNNYIQTEAVDVAFTSSAFKGNIDLNKYGVIDVMPDSEYSDYIGHSVALVLQENSNQDDAKAFIDFLSSAESSKILDYFGYSLPE